VKKLDKKLIITRLQTEQNDLKVNANMIVNALFEDQKITEISCETEEDKSILGNIYIGRVKNIVENISAAFVEVENNRQCYYSFEDNKNAIFTKQQTGKKNKTPVRIGDELLVQVNKENIKTKAPMVTSNLNFTGRYAVLTTGNKRLGFSNKLKEKQKNALRPIFENYLSEEYGFIVRTNAKDAGVEELKIEVESLIQEYQQIVSTAPYRTCFSLLKSAPSSYLENLRGIYIEGFQEIVTDCPNIYEEVRNFLDTYSFNEKCQIRLYEDAILPLWKLYSLEFHLKEALKERVWLESGAYLIIQPTEALTVIDINTGKYVVKKKAEEAYFKVNMEAAKEIARQIRLRNLSGIIIIDFIDLKEEAEKEELLAVFASYLKKDPVQTTLIGMTPLNLVEITRKKVKKPLRESLTTFCPTCHGAGYLY